MIVNFKHKGLEKFFKSGTTAGIQAKHATRLKRQLTVLDEAKVIEELNVPGWRLHLLKGNLQDHWAITVNGNWRLTFVFENGNAHIVNYQDYH